MHNDLYFLWDILEDIEYNKLKQYVDFQLSLFLKQAGYQLISVRIENDVQEYKMLRKDVHYLGAEICVRYPDGTFHTHLIRPRYEGSDDEWRRLMMGVDADDLIIRFSLGENRIEPLWTSVLFQRGRIDLSGERIDWHVLDEKEIRLDTYMEPDPFVWESSPQEDYDDRMEALDPDYDSSDNPYLDFY